MAGRGCWHCWIMPKRARSRTSLVLHRVQTITVAKTPMPSNSLHDWETSRREALDELEVAHRSVGGSDRGRRYATQQINHAYAVLLSSQFQGFCRDLHNESADSFVRTFSAGQIRSAIRNLLTQNRKLDRGNPNPGNIGSDYNRFGLLFWDEVKNLDMRNKGRLDRLEELNTWRNAIAHQNFGPGTVPGSLLRLQRVRDLRKACEHLAVAFDEVMRNYLLVVTGTSPW